MMRNTKSVLLLLVLSFIVSPLPACDNGESYPKGDGKLDPYAQAQALGRGVNFGNLLDAPTEGDWSNGIVTQEAHFDLAKNADFDSVRIPIRFSDHALKKAPYTIDETFFARVDQVVNWGLSKNLRIIIDLHHYLEIQNDPEAHRARFVALWRQIATRYKDYPDTVYFEIMNEPNGELDGAIWNSILYECLFAIRKIDNHHTVIVGCPKWSAIEGLYGLTLPYDEKNAIVTFHYYLNLFCFQGKDYSEPDCATTGITWPGPPATPITPAPGLSEWAQYWIHDYNTLTNPYENPAGRGVVKLDIKRAADWGKANKRPLWMSEFCAHDGADMTSRANWTRAVREELEANNISWSIWTLLSDPCTRLYDPDTGLWFTALTNALGLSVTN
jgi:endoglucanase